MTRLTFRDLIGSLGGTRPLVATLHRTPHSRLRSTNVASIRHTDLHVLRAGPHLPPGATPKSHAESNALDNRCIDAKKPVALRQIRRSA
ncbi:hypothetical protein BJY52DRAFT_1216070 [Lactarius psammicola]|nr:hypothetical protein BJY52DRAFT_1216070 [Lactarius psammicola]